jgi:predicted Rossmann fold flavoprotein
VKHKLVDKIYDVIVVGGGPAGMMAAGTAAARGKSVLLIEKNNRLGEKLRITGGGRCNITNSNPHLSALLKYYGKAEKFLYSPFDIFGVTDTFEFFTKRGLPLKIEAENRVFPQSESAPDVERVMEEYCLEGGVVILSASPVERILVEGARVVGVVAGGKNYQAGSVVLATGGLSHPETGSTGDGFKWLRDLGHGIAEPTPSIVPIAVKESWVKELSGTSLEMMKVSFWVNGKKKLTKKGRLLFTHFGLSGPLILNSTKQISELLHQGRVLGTIDLYPEQDFHELEQELLELFDHNKNKTLKVMLKEFLPAGMATTVLSLLESELIEKRVHSVTKDERKAMIHLLKTLPFTVQGLMGYDRAVVADGGVPLEEVDMKTMRSKKCPNLYIVGDLLHVQRPSGGFSLQLCWTSGYVAGLNA